MRRTARVVSALVGALCIAVVWAAQQSTVQTQGQAGAGVVVRQASEDANFTADYWSDERIAEAEPIPWYEGNGRADFADQGVTGPPGAASGGNASAAFSAPGLLNFVSPADLRAANAYSAKAGDGTDFGSANIYDADYVNAFSALWQNNPWRKIGKLFFTTPSGGGGYCTASVISGNNIIVTAAHCCHNRTAFNRNFAFAPAIRGITRPYGTFPYSTARVLGGWITNGGRQYDVCVLNMRPNAAGQTLSATVGWLGRSWNWPIVRHHFAIGYPSNISSGNYSYFCAAESYANCGNSLVYAQGCNQTFGSSGGPWLRVYKQFTNGSNYVNAVVSGYDACTGTFGQSFNGPRFTSNNIVPLCTAAGC